MTAAFLTIMIVFIILAAFVGYSTYNNTKKETYRFRVQTFFKTEVYEQLVGKFLDHQGDTRFDKESWSPEGTDYSYIAVDRFLEELQDQGYAVEIQSRVCDISSGRCNGILKVEKDKLTGFMSMNWNEVSAFISKKPRFTASFDIDDYLLNGNDISGTDTIHIVFPIGEKEFAADIREIANQATVHTIPVKEEKEQAISFYKVAKGAFGLYLTSIQSEVNPLTKKMLEVSYDNFNFKWNNQTVSLAPTAMAQVCVETLLAGGNIFAHGPYGTAKTTWVHTIMKMLQRSSQRVACIYLDAGTIGELAELENQEKFAQEVMEIKNEGYKIVFAIDEAEEAMISDTGVHSPINSWLLKLLDSELKNRFNCSTLLIYNAAKANLNQAFFRDMRCTFELEFKPLTSAKADQMVEALKTRMPGKVFDEARYKASRDEITLNGAGMPIVPAGQITQASVVACFIPTDVNTIIHNAINKTLKDLSPDYKPEPRQNPKIATGTVDAADTSDWDESNEEVVAVPIPKPPVQFSNRERKRQAEMARRKGKGKGYQSMPITQPVRLTPEA